MSNPSKVHRIKANDQSMSFAKAKRTRGQHDVSEALWKGTIAALSTCVSRQDCTDALSTSFRIFNHFNEEVHDEEIASGADAVLCRLLSFLLLKQLFEDESGAAQFSSGATGIHVVRGLSISVSDEVARTCQIAEMVYRCSKEVLETSFQKVGPDFLHLIVNILAHELPKYSTSSNQPTQNAANALRSVTKILCHYARVQSATLSMAQHPRLLSLMISLLQLPLGVIPCEAHHSALWVLANMACCNGNMQSMVSHGGLLDTVIQAANAMHEIGRTRPIDHHALRLQHSAFRCLLNLSWDQRNKSLMSERDDLVGTIRKTVETKTLPWSGNDARNSFGAMLLQTRLFALGTLRNVAHTLSPQQYHLCTTQDGMLLDLLCDTARNDEDTTVRNKAFAVVFNLVTTDTAELLISHPGLLDSLVEAASVPGDFQGANVAESASTMSFRSLNALEQAVSSRGPEECQLKVRRAIEQVNMSRRLHNMAAPPE